MMDWGEYEHFTKKEFDCKETGENGMKQAFLDRLQALRHEYNKPMVITSGYRSPNHSLEARKSSPGPHTTGMAADIRVGPGEDVHTLLELAFRYGFTGIGVSQREGRPRFVHLDMINRKAVWGY